MVGDWVSQNGMSIQITFVGNGYASFEDDGGNPCQLDDKYNRPEPILLTPEILEKNGFVFDCDFWTIANPRYNNVRIVTYYSIGDDVADTFLGHWAFDENYAIDYVHELQHALRLCGFNEIANNFKI